MGARDRFTDRLGVAAILLIAFAVWLDELGAEQLDRVPQLLKLSCPVLRTATGFQPNETRRQLGDRLQQFAPGHAVLDDDFALFLDPMQLEEPFGPSNPEGGDRQGESSLSLVNGVSILASYESVAGGGRSIPLESSSL